ncbi:MAG: hypothetical protein ACLS3S_01995 [Streptococcus salivarius]
MWQPLGRLHSSWSALDPLFGQRVPGKQLHLTGYPFRYYSHQIPYFGSGLGSGVVRASLLIYWLLLLSFG